MGHWDRAQERTGGNTEQAGAGTGAGDGMALVHALAQRKAQSLFADLMAGAGVGYNQIAKEVFFFMPQELLDVYAAVWYKGVAGKDDGGIGARGRAQADAGRVGKASINSQDSGKKTGAGGAGGAKRRSYKKYWVIADEDALEIKDRADKRLRGLARDLRDELEALEWSRTEEGRIASRAAGQAKVGARSRHGARAYCRCTGCGRMIREGWKFCPYDGQEIRHDDINEN